jgi:hypothetical protein
VIAAVKQRLLVLRWWIRHLDRRQLRVWLYTMTRPASYPYISGDGFRRMAKHIYDETNLRLPGRNVRDGDIVFVSTEYAFRFFHEVAPAIRARYKLITHNSDVPVDLPLISLAGEHAQVWFARNNAYEHPKVVPIPIGLENLYNYNVGIPRDYSRLRGFAGPRKARILSRFTIDTNPRERQPAFEVAEAAPCVDQLPTRVTQSEYLTTLVRYKFVLSPPGNGLDTNRTWEALYLGTVPIVKDSVAMRSFRRLGLPIWILQDWTELLSVSEQELEERYQGLRRGFSSPALFMDYWRQLIRDSAGPDRQAAPGSRGPSTGLANGQGHGS